MRRVQASPNFTNGKTEARGGTWSQAAKLVDDSPGVTAGLPLGPGTEGSSVTAYVMHAPARSAWKILEVQKTCKLDLAVRTAPPFEMLAAQGLHLEKLTLGPLGKVQANAETSVLPTRSLNGPEVLVLQCQGTALPSNLCF